MDIRFTLGEMSVTEARGLIALLVATHGSKALPQSSPETAELDTDEPEIVTMDAAPAQDRTGLPWDERIHSGSKAITSDGVWRSRKGVSAEIKAAVEAELRGALEPPAPPPPAQVDEADAARAQATAAAAAARAAEEAKAAAREAATFPAPADVAAAFPAPPAPAEVAAAFPAPPAPAEVAAAVSADFTGFVALIQYAGKLQSDGKATLEQVIEMAKQYGEKNGLAVAQPSDFRAQANLPHVPAFYALLQSAFGG